MSGADRPDDAASTSAPTPRDDAAGERHPGEHGGLGTPAPDHPGQAGATDPRPVRPRQLPPVTAHFVSRVEQLAGLDDLVTPPSRGPGSGASVAVVIGPGGVGKTALAVMWANAHASRFRDGQLYVDLRGFSPDTTVTPVDALGRLLRSLGVEPEQVPATLAERVSLYRTITAEQELLILVLLDNAASAEQVRPLIPTSTRSVVVVTSRLWLGSLLVDGAQLVEVPPLTQADAVALLVKLVGERRARADPDAVAELAQLCGQLPIALRVAAARLITRPRWPVSDVVARLRDERSRLAALSHPSSPEDSVMALFDWSYCYLDPYAADLYRLLGTLPAAEFGIGVAAAVTQLGKHEARTGLQALVDASLLEELDRDRYRFHDLVRLHARAQPDEERHEVIPRAGAWYLREMTRANLVVIPTTLRWRVSPVADQLAGEPAPFDSEREALDWLARELPNVLAVLEEAIADRHDELAWQLCEALWELQLYRKPHPELLRAYELGIIAAQRCGNTVAESRLRYQLGRAYLDLGEPDSAEQEILHAIELARDAQDRRNESAALELLGRLTQARGDLDTALGYFTTSLDIEAELGIDRGVASRHRRIGEALVQAGRETEAAPHLRTALQMFAAAGDDKDLARLAVGQALLDARSGRTEAAIDRLTAARLVLGRSGSAVFEASVLLALAEVAKLDGQPDQARSHLNEAVELLRDLGGAALAEAREALTALDHGLARQDKHDHKTTQPDTTESE
jgi:tetratricopeptide (TPR) repeat protein